ncbi:MAG TPA: LacI family transcriptional regulator [Clostridiales bacterium]|nr:LacI family transcriptional regulator [Clostridiales bacterium]
MEGKKLPTVYDIAKKAGVSVATVSRVINHPDIVKRPTYQKVLDAMNTLGYQKLASSENNVHGHRSIHTYENHKSRENLLFLINMPSNNNPFYGDIIEGAQSAARRHGHFLLSSCLNLNDFSIDSLFLLVNNHHISGIINTTDTPYHLLMRIQNTMPIVQCSEYNETCTSVSYVSIDDIEASRKAVEYAISTGHKKVAILNSTYRFHYADRRKTGYALALLGAGLEIVPEWVIQIPDVDFSMAYSAASKLFALPNPPDAVFTISDIFAAATIKAAAAAGLRVPQDVIVIGFDNINVSITTTPSITTVGQPRYQLGYTAFEILLNETMNPNTPKQQILLDTELIIREST